jgi:hypothetical protein
MRVHTTMTDFNLLIKSYVALYETKLQLTQKIRDLNVELKDLNVQVLAHMEQNEIPGIEYGEYKLRLASTRRKPGISEKLIQGCTYFANDEEKIRFIDSLAGQRPTTVKPILRIKKKI